VTTKHRAVLRRSVTQRSRLRRRLGSIGTGLPPPMYLKRLEMNRLPASQKHKAHDKRWKRYEKQLPGHRVQIDVKFIEPIRACGRCAASGGGSSTNSPP
jgi:hypothetical protein